MWSFHKASLRRGTRSMLGLCTSVPYFRTLQLYVMWCCRLAVRLLSIYRELTSFMSFRLISATPDGSSIAWFSRRIFPTLTTVFVRHIDHILDGKYFSYCGNIVDIITDKPSQVTGGANWCIVSEQYKM